MKRLDRSVAVVTGASSGIGRATALAFARRGAAVVLVARREHALSLTAQECRELGADALVLPADVADHAAVESVAQEAVGTYGRIDVWVNNAAVNLFANLEEAPVTAWHGVVQTNLFGTYHGVRAALPWMREQGSGVIVNVSSVLGKIASPYQSAYVASKHAVRALSDSVRQEVGDVPGISVCTVLPGPVDTPLFERAGNYTGRAIKPVKPVISAERVAEAIVGCARSPRREVIVGGSTAQALLANRVSPALAERVAARQVASDHFGRAPAAPAPGNVLEPQEGEPATVSGGWSRTSQATGAFAPQTASNSGGSLRKVLVGTGVAAAAYTGLRWLRRS